MENNGVNEDAQKPEPGSKAQKPSKAPANKKQLLLVLGFAGFLGAGYFVAQTFFPEMLAGILGGASENSSEVVPSNTQMNAKILAPGGLKNENSAMGKLANSALCDGDDEEDSDAAPADSEDSDNSEALLKFSDLEPGAESNDRVLDALDRLQSWQPVEGAYPESALHHYLVHKKLWVRMAALAFAAETKNYDASFLKSAGAEIRAKYPRAQVQRYLKRLRAKNVELYAEVSSYLAR